MYTKEFSAEEKKEMRDALKVSDDHLKVAEIFSTIQGEGPNTGIPVIFIRLQLCNLHCVWCFIGNTLICTPKGQRPIKDISIGDLVYGFDCTKGIITTTEVTNIFSRDVSSDDICLVQAGHKKVFCTCEHEFFVKGKEWIPAKDLKVGDIIYDLPQKQLNSMQMLGEKNPMKKVATREKMSKTIRNRYKVGGLSSYKRSDELRMKESLRMKGDNNPMKDPEVVKKSVMNRFQGPSILEERYISKFEDFPIRYTGDNTFPVGDSKSGWIFPDFVIEGKKKVIEIYHTGFTKYQNKQGFYQRDAGWEEDRRKFLTKFGFEVLFLTEKDQRGWKEKVIPFINNGRKVTKVIRNLSDKQKARLVYPVRRTKDSICQVYNIETVSHNYYANTMLVHNCDTPYTWNWEGTDFNHATKDYEQTKYDPRQEIILMTPSEIIDKVKELAGKSVKRIVWTGGEPLVQQRSKAFVLTLALLYGAGFKIEIETNGTLKPSEKIRPYIEQYNVSPKLENSDNTIEERRKTKPYEFYTAQPNAYFKFVVTGEADMVEIEDLRKRFNIPTEKILLMPEGRTEAEVKGRAKELVKICIEKGYRFCNRLQVWVWDGALRGV